MDITQPVVSPRYKSDVVFALGVQLVVGLFAMLLLDGGRMARVVGVAVLAFWLATALVMTRRPHSPTSFDLAWIRWGFWPVLFAAGWVAFGV